MGTPLLLTSQPTPLLPNGDCISSRFTTADLNRPGGDVQTFSVDLDRAGTITADLFDVPQRLDLRLSIYGLDYRGREVLLAGGEFDTSAGGAELSAAAYVKPGVYYIQVESGNGLSARAVLLMRRLSSE